MIFRTRFVEKSEENLAIFSQNTALFWQRLHKTLAFKKTPNSGYIIDPRKKCQLQNSDIFPNLLFLKTLCDDPDDKVIAFSVNFWST
jgi:hypothetical protein